MQRVIFLLVLALPLSGCTGDAGDDLVPLPPPPPVRHEVPISHHASFQEPGGCDILCFSPPPSWPTFADEENVTLVAFDITVDGDASNTIGQQRPVEAVAVCAPGRFGCPGQTVFATATGMLPLRLTAEDLLLPAGTGVTVQFKILEDDPLWIANLFGDRPAEIRGHVLVEEVDVDVPEAGEELDPGLEPPEPPAGNSTWELATDNVPFAAEGMTPLCVILVECNYVGADPFLFAGVTNRTITSIELTLTWDALTLISESLAVDVRIDGPFGECPYNGYHSTQGGSPLTLTIAEPDLPEGCGFRGFVYEPLGLGFVGARQTYEVEGVVEMQYWREVSTDE